VTVCALALGVQGAARPAGAYVLMSTSSGKPVYWPRRCVEWYLHQAGSADADWQATYDAAVKAAETWNAVSGAYVKLAGRGATCFGSIGKATWPGAQNLLRFYDGQGSWPHGERVVGLTTVTFVPAGTRNPAEEGQIVDADVEINGEDFSFGVPGSKIIFDIQATALHELGHALGLDHVTEKNAVMYPSADAADLLTKTALTSDEIAGVEANHPIASAPTSAPTCEVLAPSVYPLSAPYCPKDPGCSAASGRGGVGGALWAALLLGILGVRRKRRAVLGMAGLALVVSSAPSAHGYVLYKASKSGIPLHWTVPAPVFQVQAEIPTDWSTDDLLVVVDRALGVWTGLEPWSISWTRSDPASHGSFDAEEQLDTQSWFLWIQDEWPLGELAVATTLVAHHSVSGKIEAADVLVNTVDYDLRPDLACSEGVFWWDLQSVLTHELGHALGIDHSEVSTATMFTYTDPGLCKWRTLSDDDVEAYAAAYLQNTVEPEPGPEPVEAAPDAVPTEAVWAEPAPEVTLAGRRDECGAGGGGRLALALGALCFWVAVRHRGRRSQRSARAPEYEIKSAFWHGTRHHDDGRRDPSGDPAGGR
jgi:MYXO-CTERM domain-containing protein